MLPPAAEELVPIPFGSFRCWMDGTVPALIDLPDFFWPMKAYTAARWAAGSVPLWNPLSGCGEPWLAQLQTGVFYPGDFAFFLPWPHGPLAAILLHLVVASAGADAQASQRTPEPGGAVEHGAKGGAPERARAPAAPGAG